MLINFLSDDRIENRGFKLRYEIVSKMSSLKSKEDSKMSSNTTNENHANFAVHEDIPCGMINNPEKRIVGGNETRPYSMPWTVALVNEDSSLLCGGVIISS